MPYNNMQNHAIPAMQCNSIQYHAIQCNTMQDGAGWCKIVQDGARWFQYQSQKTGFEKDLSLGLEKFGLGKKSQFRFRKIWYRKKSLCIGFG